MVHFFVHLFNLNCGCPKHTVNVRTSFKTKERPEPRKHTKDLNFGYLGVFNLDFFRHYETFLKLFYYTKGPPSLFLKFFNRMDGKKFQRVPLSHFSALRHCSKFSIFVFFRKFSNVSKGPPSIIFIFCNKLEFQKAQREFPPFTILKT